MKDFDVDEACANNTFWQQAMPRMIEILQTGHADTPVVREELKRIAQFLDMYNEQHGDDE